MVLGMVRMCKCCDGSVVVQVRIWTFRVSGSAMCVTMQFPTTLPMGPLGRRRSRSSGPPTRSSGPRHVPPRNNGNGNEPPLGPFVGPSSAETEVGKKGEVSELLQALSLLQSIMSPEDLLSTRSCLLSQKGRKPWNRSWQIG